MFLELVPSRFHSGSSWTKLSASLAAIEGITHDSIDLTLMGSRLPLTLLNESEFKRAVALELREDMRGN